MSLLPKYSPRDNSISWGGITFDGEAKDFLTITPNANITDTEVGAGGDRGVTENPDRTCTVSYTCLQTSITNRKIVGILEEQRRIKKLAVGNFVVNDSSGSLLAYIKEAYLEAGPEQGYTNAMGQRTWTWNAELVYSQDASGVEYDTAIQTSLQAEIQAAIGLVFN